MWEMTRSGQLPWAVLVSLNRVVQGFVYGAAIGIVLGLLAGAVRWIEDVLDPWGGGPLASTLELTPRPNRGSDHGPEPS